MYTYDFQRHETIKYLYGKIHTQKASIVEAGEEYSK